MAIIEDIKKMQLENRSERDIIEALQDAGYDSHQVSEAMAQVKIKDAVTTHENYEVPHPENSMPQEESIPPLPSSVNSMQPSVLDTSQQPGPQETAPQEYYQQYQPTPQQEYAYQPYAAEYSQASPMPSTSADTISEIAEQVVAEKLQDIRSSLEKVIDVRTNLNSRLDSVEERLKRIEKVIDRLQLSILQKVGEYFTSIEDIKTELQETQKSFKSLLPKDSAREPSQKNFSQ